MNCTVHWLQSQTPVRGILARAAARSSCCKWCPPAPLPASHCWSLVVGTEQTEHSICLSIPFYLGSFDSEAASQKASWWEMFPPNKASRGTWRPARLSRAARECVCPNKHLFSENCIPLSSCLKNARGLSAGKHSASDQNRKMKPCFLVRKLYLFPPEKLAVILISGSHWHYKPTLC